MDTPWSASAMGTGRHVLRKLISSAGEVGMTAPMDALHRRRLGDFELREQLGEGGVGVVYRALQPALGREAVIKLLRAPHRGRQEMSQRFVREAQLASRLEHPYVAHVYAFGAEADGLLWIAMERVRGVTLSDFLRQHGPWPVERLVPFFDKICEAVQTAHEQGIVHRDLKPSNVMVLPRAGQLLPKLLDFGLAKWLGAPEDGGEDPHLSDDSPHAGPAASDAGQLATVLASSDTMVASDQTLASGQTLASDQTLAPDQPLEPGSANTAVSGGKAVSQAMGSASGQADTAPDITRTGAMLGSPAYMAPEQWSNPAEAAEPADQYALGVLLFETLSGQLPFLAPSLVELERMHRQDAPPPIRSVQPVINQVLERALAKDPADRYGSVLELGGALRLAAQRLPPSVSEAAAAPAVIDAETPYRGLSSFQPEHRGLFFGREEETRALIARLCRDPLVVVAGDSGVGKSSMCRAGAIPLVREGALGDGRRWRIASLQPGRRPATALAMALASVVEAPDQDLDLMVALVGQQVRRRTDEDESNGVLIFIDQLEELVTLSAPDEAERFVAALLSLSSLPGGVRVLAATRGDFITRVLGRFGTGEEVARTMFVLGPLNEAGIRAAITRPALALGYRFESDEMVDALCNEAARLEGALPLLQFALAELWALRDKDERLLRVEALEQVGGIAGIVARHADGVVQRMRPGQRAAVRRILLRLVTPERTRSRRQLDELLRSDDDEDGRSALEAMIQGRIVVARDDEEDASYELAHEVLITRWDTLADWLDRDVEQHAARERLRAAAAEWQRMGRARDGLYGDAQLRDIAVLNSAELDAQAAAFVRASRHALRRRRLAWRSGLVAAFAILAAVAAALTYLNREARHQTREADRHIVKLYTEQGRRALLDGYRQRALLYLAEAWRRGGRSPGLQFLLQRAGTALDQEVAVLRGHQTLVQEARFSPDGRTVVTVSDDHTARLWDPASGRQLQLLRGHTDWVRAVAFSPDGEDVMTVSWDGTARLWKVASGEQLWVVDLRQGRPVDPSLHGAANYLSVACAADFAADGQRALAACVDSTAAVISRETGTVETWLAGRGSFVTALSLAPDGNRVLATYYDHPGRLFDRTTGEPVAELAGPPDRRAWATFSPDSTRVLTLGLDKVARIWSSDNGQLVAALTGHQAPILGGRFSPDGSRAITYGADSTIRLWDASSGTPTAVLRNHSHPVTAADISPDGSLIFSGDHSGLGILSDLGGRRLAVFEGHQASVWTARFSPDGARMVTASHDGTARIWRVAGDDIERLPGDSAPIMALAFSPTEPLLFSASESGALTRWRLDQAPAPQTFAKVEQGLLGLAVSDDGKLVAAGGLDGIGRIWDVQSGRLTPLRATDAAINAVAFDNAGSTLATASSDHLVRLWDSRSGSFGGELAGGGGTYASPIAFDPSSGSLATGGHDGVVRIWDPRARRELRQVDHDGPIHYVTFCGDRLVVASGAVVRIWRSDGTPDATLSAPGPAILASSCHKGRIVLGASGELQLWDVETGALLESVQIGASNIMTVAVAADGQVAVGDLGGGLTLIRLHLDGRVPDTLAAMAAERLPLELTDSGGVRLAR